MLADGPMLRTPLLVPSYSSEAVQTPISQVWTGTRQNLDSTTLVSAYDLHYGKLPAEDVYGHSGTLFVDSGGYELIQAKRDKKAFHPWTRDIYRSSIDKFVRESSGTSLSIVVTSFDHPEENRPFDKQIDAAIATWPETGSFVREFLLKPEAEGRPIAISALARSVHRLKQFGIIGIAEKEMGDSLFDRMCTIAKLRMLLASANLHTPIHVFGCLDPITTPLYFLVGADIFDGLSWLRYRFVDGYSAYLWAAGALDEDGLRRPLTMGGLVLATWRANLTYIARLQDDMRRYLRTNVLDGQFGRHKGFLEKSRDLVFEELEGVGGSHG